MTSISKLQQTLQALRTQKTETAASQQSRKNEQPGAADRGRANSFSLEEKLRDRLRSLSAEQKESSRSSRIAIVESLLSHELGASVELDPHFSELVGRVVDILEQDEQVLLQMGALEKRAL